MKKLLVILSVFFCSFSQAQTTDSLLNNHGVIVPYVHYIVPNLTNGYFNRFGAFVAFNTDSISEGSTNLWFTNARARSAISYTGENYLSYNNSTGVLTGSAVNLSGSNVTGTLPTTKGGTGLTSFTANGIFYASSTSAISQIGVPAHAGMKLGWNGTSYLWQDTTAVGGSSGWNTTGNSGLTAPTNFLGTTDNINLIFKRNSINAGIIDSTSATAGKTGFGSGALNVNIGNNSAFGFRALNVHSSATSNNNTAIGSLALLADTSGANNVAVGDQVLKANLSGSGNTAIGASALIANTTGTNNVAIGLNSLAASTTTSSNIAIGQGAMQTSTGASNNVVVGNNNAGKSLTSTGNVVVGDASMAANSNSGTNNTAVGYQASSKNTSGASNVGVGVNALFNNLTGGDNTAVGRDAANANTASGVTAVGSIALFSGTGANNTAIGLRSLQSTTTGTNNVGLGTFAGRYLVSSNALAINGIDRVNIRGDSTASPVMIWQNSSPISQKGALNAKIGIFNNQPSAFLQLPAGTADAGTASLKITAPQNLATLTANQVSTSVTITYAYQVIPPFIVGSKIVVAGVTPAGYNGTFTVVTCDNNSVTYSTTAGLGTQTVAGTITQGQLLATPESGAIESDGTHLYWTDATGTRKQLD